MKENDNNSYARDFIYTCPSSIFKDQSISLNELKIYMMIRSFMDTTGVAYPSNNWIAKQLGITRRNAIHNINKLIDKGYVERVENNGKRFLRIKLSFGVEEVVSPASPPSVASITPPSVADDTQLDQNTITSKTINNTPIPPQGGCERFEEFWNLYPVKKAKKVCQEKWRKKNLDNIADEILTNLDIQILNDKTWIAGYVPNPLTYLNQERWSDEVDMRERGSTAAKQSTNNFNQVINSQKTKRGYYDENGNYTACYL